MRWYNSAQRNQKKHRPLYSSIWHELKEKQLPLKALTQTSIVEGVGHQGPILIDVVPWPEMIKALLETVHWYPCAPPGDEALAKMKFWLSVVITGIEGLLGAVQRRLSKDGSTSSMAVSFVNAKDTKTKKRNKGKFFIGVMIEWKDNLNILKTLFYT